MKNEINNAKEFISQYKKLITIFILTPFIPLAILFSVLTYGKMKTAQITVDERFSLSSSMKSPYDDILKGIYQFSFAFCGDPHMQAEGDGFFSELNEYIKANKAAFVIFGGDLTFLGKDAEYENFVKHASSLTVPPYPAIGNHDLYNNGWSNYWKYLGPSAYSFYGGNAKFIVIDTATGDIGEKQMEWLTKELKGNRQPLLFVISHMPIYGGLQGKYEFPKTQERVELINLFEKYEVDFVLEGHYHGFVDITVNGVRYITSGSFNETLLDSGLRHFLFFRVYGPNVTVEKVIVGADIPIDYRATEI